jgi:microcystin-dependent protein
MTTPYLAEIRIFPFSFAPFGWAQCNGQLMAISQNTALFSLLGVTFGGDGKTTFGLPNLQGSVPLQWGQGPGLTYRNLGEKNGSEQVTLSSYGMPPHTHALMASAHEGTLNTPSSAAGLARSNPTTIYNASGALAPLNANAVTPAGGNLPHNNLMPYLTLNFCIALQGLYPPRS